jgi:hypothetical protein
MRVEYDSNNSGGGWWLNDRNWKDLEKAGWKVNWIANQTDWDGTPYKDGRWLGALARSAEKHGVSSLKEAVQEWERVTGLSSTDAGCPCCGQPHSFTLYDDNDKYIESGPTVRYEANWED